LLGEYRTQRSVPGATILGGETMVAHVASYAALGTGALPRQGEPCRVHDEVDVADLESEVSHGYDVLGGTSGTNLVLERDGAVDGGRSERTVERFVMSLVPGGRFVSRVQADEADALELFVGSETLGRRPLANGRWQEVAWTIPPQIPSGRSKVELHALGGSITALHYWSLEACKAAVP
jgi:hypothetical protein